MKIRMGSWFHAGRWIGLLELVLLAALAIVLAQWTWLAFTPNPVAESGLYGSRELDASTTPIKRGLFGVVNADDARQAPATASSLRLVGVVAPSSAGRGRAIFASHGGGRKVVNVGEALSDGMVLRDVYPDHVTVMQDGATERINLDRRAAVAITRRARPDVTR